VTAAGQTATYGAAGTLTATVPTTGATGQVTFTDTTTSTPVSIGQADVGAGGVAALSVPSVLLGAGAHTITAAYGGSTTLDGSSTTFTLTVSKAATTVVSNTVIAGQGTTASVPVTVTATGGSPDGTVTVLDASNATIGTATLVDGAATVAVSTSGLAAGDNTVTISYAGNANFIASTKTITITITVALKSSSVTARAASAAYGGRIVLPITVTGTSGTPTGKVQVLYGSTSLGTVTLSGGKATLSVSASVLGVGGHSLLLKYSGDSVYASSTGVGKATVTKAVPILGTKILGGPIKVGKGGSRLYVAVVATGVQASGKVTLVVHGRTLHGTLTKGHVRIRLPVFRKAGKVKATLRYVGNSHVAAVQTSVTLKVKRR
jgi:hypothetical protein